MSRRSRWLALLALLAGIGILFAMTTSVFAYGPQVPTIITVSPSSGTLKCDRWYIVRATVLDQDGKPIKHLTVTWSLTSSPSSNDQIKPAASNTNGRGVAKVLVNLACVAGDRVITATSDGISGSAVLHVDVTRHGNDEDGSNNAVAAAVSAGTRATPGQAAGAVLGISAHSLPSTSTLPADASLDSLPLPAIPAVVALLAAVGIILRRFALSRR
jgi:hypothetical protein